MQNSHSPQTSEPVDESSVLKAQLVRLRLEAERQLREPSQPINRRAETESIIPLSSAQERLWFLDQIGLADAAYNVPLAIRLSGILNENALQESFSELLRRHEILRTRISVHEGTPCQIVDPAEKFKLSKIDLGAIDSECARNERIAEISKAEQLGRFNLSSGPPIRVRLLTIAAGKHILLITMHHIVSDGWSVGILIRELSAIYSAYAKGLPSPFPDLEVQYADFAIWQRRRLSGGAIAKQLAYWKSRLAPPLAALQMPTDRLRPDVETFNGAAFRFTVSPTVCDLLRDLSKSEGATLFMICLSAYQMLLARWCGQNEIIVGSPIAGRVNQEVEALIGFFVNTLVLRGQVIESETYQNLLHRTKEITFGAYANQEVPFELLVKELRPERKLTRQPLFQVWLAVQNYPDERLDLPGLEWSWASVERVNTLFDLMLYVFDSRAGFYCVLEYATDLFESKTIEILAKRFSGLLEAIAANSKTTIHDLWLRSEVHDRHLEAEWNRTAIIYEHPVCVHNLVEKQAEHTPHAVAVVYQDESLTYSELNARANQLARYLRARGVRPERLVGMYVDRCLDMVVGLLGILKAGGAYVPLDPNYPIDRIEYMVRDSAPTIVLIKEHLRQRLPPTPVTVVSLDHDWQAICKYDSDNLDATVGLHQRNLAYVIYTSGSTGRPKGAMNEHLAVINRLLWMQERYQITCSDRVLQKTPFSFDVSVWEFFLPLICGARIVMARPEGHKDPSYLHQLVEQAEITIIHFVPSMLQIFLDQQRVGWCPTLRRVICSGEELPDNLRRKFFDRLPHACLSNLYGPTEAAVDVTAWECNAKDTNGRVPIGHPIANIQIHILDPNHNQSPLGSIGELYIGGVGVGRGYHNRPSLTAERFIADPFDPESGARLYRTGDLARWRIDGNIEYLGRNDNQVKIRGNRIELGEIESAMVQHPSVRQAVVLARDDTPDQRRLVGYVVYDRCAGSKWTSNGSLSTARESLVNEWQAVYERTYEPLSETTISEFSPNFVGWNSSYTGKPIPDREMNEWLLTAIQRIKDLNPRRTLEIGCGMGLYLMHLARECSVYVATDLSASVVAQLKMWASKQDDLDHVNILRREATDFRGFIPHFFDTVILNSVVQYFPDIDYLLSVLTGIVSITAPGGKIFVGDVRHLGTLATFHSSIQLRRAAPSLSVRELRNRIDRAISQDKELAIDPRFFELLVGNLPGIRTAKIDLKGGRSNNELVNYRYDVTLEVGEPIDFHVAYEHLDWIESMNSVSLFKSILGEGRFDAIRVSGVPNSRIANEAAAANLIRTLDDEYPVSELRGRIDQQSIASIDPEEIREMAASRGYEVTLIPGDGSLFDIQLRRPRSGDQTRMEPRQRMEIPCWSKFANDPFGNSFAQRLVSDLRDYLKRRLPEYMLPAVIVFLDQLPLSPNGKVDRNALPAPQTRTVAQTEHAPPSNEVEHSLAEIWNQLLVLDQVGIDDNFFELGGHSLLAVKLITLVAERLAVRLSVASAFQYPTIRQLARVVEALQILNSPPVEENLDSVTGTL